MTTEFDAAQEDASGRASERRAYEAAISRQATRIEELSKKLDLVTALDDATLGDPNPWPRLASSQGSQPCIANLLLSDLHLDEVVVPAQVQGCNAFNRKIGLLRLRGTVERTIEVAFDYLQGITYDGLQVWLNGDIFSGNIHEELKETNETPILASFDYWLDPMVEALRALAGAFGKVNVSVRVGNHGRLTRKPVMKNRVEDNFDFLFGRVLARECKGDPRITWDIPLSADGIVKEYDTRFLATHGDQFRGGSGISGIQTPLALGDYKKRKRQSNLGAPYDVMVLGHFHQLLWMPGVIVNGSLKGYDEYAYMGNMAYEVPQQAFWVVTPKQGMTFQCAIRPSSRKVEKW